MHTERTTRALCPWLVCQPGSITNTILLAVYNIEDPNSEAAKAKSRADAQRRQAIWELDMGMWQDLVALLRIEESIIPHRQDEVRPVGPGQWYH